MSADTVLLARLQFGFTAVAHWLFVALTLGLVTYVVIAQTLWYRTGDPVYERMTRFWGQLYVVNYALGIATGIVMEFQFGLNWSGLTHFTGNVIGTPLSIETLVAFFLESTFLALWIFGWHVLSRRMHLAAIWLTALTAWSSVILVVIANAFIQHPVGSAVENGKAVLTDLGALLSNPNAAWAVPHAATASLTTGMIVVLGISAWHLRRLRPGDADHDVFRRSFQIALYLAIPAVFTTALVGGLMLDVVNVEMPIKGVVFDEDFVAAERLAAEAEGRFGPGNYLPPVLPILVAKLIMRNTAIVLLALVLIVALLTVKDRLWRDARLQKVVFRVFVWVIPLPFVAGACGWIFREVGRQPWAVFEVLKTGDAITPGRTAGAMLASLVVFALLIGALAVTDWWLLARFARSGPDGSHLGRTAEDFAVEPPAPPVELPVPVAEPTVSVVTAARADDDSFDGTLERSP